MFNSGKNSGKYFKLIWNGEFPEIMMKILTFKKKQGVENN